jgi:uncharacterized membrane protein
MTINQNRSLFDEMGRDPDNYKWGIFYYNPEDPRIFLPKRIQWMGWTLNFANWRSYLVLTGIAAFATLMVLIAPIL